MAGSTIVYLVVGAVVVLLGSDRLPVPAVALGSAATLWITGVLPLGDAAAGFWSPTVWFVASLLIVATALDRCGATAIVGSHLQDLAAGSGRRLTVWTMVAAAGLTAIVTVHGAVAALIPVAVTAAATVGLPASKVLLPLAVAAHAGTQLTLTGSQVNILFSEASRDAGAGYFTFFEYSAVGVPLVVGTVAIVTLWTRRLLPDRSPPSELPSPVASDSDRPPRRTGRALVIVALMVVALATGVVQPVVAGLGAAGAMVVTGVLSPRHAVRGIDWKTIVMIAGMIPLSTAMTRSGVAYDIAHAIAVLVGGRSIYLLLAALFVVTSTLTQLMSNTATALVMIPIAVQAAYDLDVSVRPVLMSVNVVVVAALLTPVGTAGNTMILRPGGYRNADYVRFGLPLLAWWFVIAVLYVPLIWRP